MAGQFTGSSKRVEAHPKSSNLVVNSVALSRDLPVFTGFFEIIRVVILNIQVMTRLLSNTLNFYLSENKQDNLYPLKLVNNYQL